MDLKKVYFAKLKRKHFFFSFTGRMMYVGDDELATTRGPTASHNSSHVEWVILRNPAQSLPALKLPLTSCFSFTPPVVQPAL